MSKKGFAVSGMIYTILLLFVMLITTLLFNLQNRKTILDELKNETVSAVESDNQIEALEQRIANLENPVNLFIKTHPVGSIYVTIASDEASVEMMNSKYTGSTWEVYGQGRVLVGIGDNGQTSYLKANTNGGSASNSITLSTANLPSHSHTISHTHTTPQTNLSNGATSKAGFHTHSLTGPAGHQYAISMGEGTIQSSSVNFIISTSNINNNGYYAKMELTSTGDHLHTVSGTIPAMTTNSISTTKSGSTGSGTAFNVSTVQPYTVVYMYRRIS